MKSVIRKDRKMHGERWLDISGYEGLYKASSLGRISGHTKNILNPGDNGRGYLFVNLYKSRIPKRFYVHRLVALAFLDKNGAFSEINLEWIDPKGNSFHARNSGLCNQRGENSVNAKLSWEDVQSIRASVKNGEKQNKLAEKFNVSKSLINIIAKNRRWICRDK